MLVEYIILFDGFAEGLCNLLSARHCLFDEGYAIDQVFDEELYAVRVAGNHKDVFEL